MKAFVPEVTIALSIVAILIVALFVVVVPALPEVSYPDTTWHRNTDQLTLTWTPAAYALAYEVYQNDTKVGETFYNVFTVILTFGERARFRVIPIDYSYTPHPDKASPWSDWYIYGLQISKSGYDIILTWPGDLGMVTLYRSTDMCTWSPVKSTDLCTYTDSNILYQADKMFYRLAISE